MALLGSRHVAYRRWGLVSAANICRTNSRATPVLAPVTNKVLASITKLVKRLKCIMDYKHLKKIFWRVENMGGWVKLIIILVHDSIYLLWLPRMQVRVDGLRCIKPSIYDASPPINLWHYDVIIFCCNGLLQVITEVISWNKSAHDKCHHSKDDGSERFNTLISKRPWQLSHDIRISYIIQVTCTLAMDKSDKYLLL